MAIAAVANAVFVLAGCGSTVSHANTDGLAKTVGAAWCADTSYELENQLDGSKTELYSCNMPNGSYRCVTEEGGIAHDVTVEAKLVFASTLGAAKPDCVRPG